MKILITGTAGFIGFHLAKFLLEDGHEIVGLDNINDYYDVDLKYGRLKETGIGRDDLSGAEGSKVRSSTYDNYSFYKLDLTDRESIEQVFEEEEFDVVIHLAAQAGVRYSLKNPHSYVDSNVVGFLNILEGCRHCDIDHLIYASSSSVYGANSEMPFKTTDKIDQPVSMYAATKKSNELMAYTYSHLYDIPTTGLRFFTVYGPWGRPDMAIFLFVKAIFEGNSIDVFNYGEMERDFTYVDDIVEGIKRLIPKVPEPERGNLSGRDSDEKQEPVSESTEHTSGAMGQAAEQAALLQKNTAAPYQLFNIGYGSPVPLMEFIGEIEKNTGIEAEKNMMPIQPGDVKKTWAEVEDLYNVINFRPRVTVDEGVKRFVDWYKAYYGKG